MVLFIDWEGRSYTIDSLRADLLNVEKGMKGKLYSYSYDTGILITDSLPPNFTEVKTLRKGQMFGPENWLLPLVDYEHLGPHVDIPDEGPAARKSENWTEHADIKSMLWSWFKDGFIT